MRTAAWTPDRTLALAEKDPPALAAGHVLVRPAHVGICGSDLHFFRGEFPPRIGSVPGHEISGYVAEGEGFEAGTPVAIDPALGCGKCPSCRRGQVPTCERLRLMGISAAGGMQEFMVAPAANVHPLPEGVSPELGSLAEPLAVCVRALNRAEAPLGSRVLVLGSGTIGLISTLLAMASAVEVVATARYPHQAEVARAFGASQIFAPGSPELLDWAAANPVDLVIETVGGTADTLSEAINAVRGGGTVLPLGVFTQDVMIPARKLVNQEVRVIGSVVYGHEGGQSEFAAAVQLLPRYAEKLSLLKSAIYPLENANEAFEHALDKGRRGIKVSVAVRS